MILLIASSGMNNDYQVPRVVYTFDLSREDNAAQFNIL